MLLCYYQDFIENNNSQNNDNYADNFSAKMYDQSVDILIKLILVAAVKATKAPATKINI